MGAYNCDTCLNITFSDYRDPKCVYLHRCHLGCRGRRELFDPSNEIIIKRLDLLFEVFGLKEQSIGGEYVALGQIWLTHKDYA